MQSVCMRRGRGLHGGPEQSSCCQLRTPTPKGAAIHSCGCSWQRHSSASTMHVVLLCQKMATQNTCCSLQVWDVDSCVSVLVQIKVLLFISVCNCGVQAYTLCLCCQKSRPTSQLPWLLQLLERHLNAPALHNIQTQVRHPT